MAPVPYATIDVNVTDLSGNERPYSALEAHYSKYKMKVSIITDTSIWFANILNTVHAGSEIESELLRAKNLMIIGWKTWRWADGTWQRPVLLVGKKAERALRRKIRSS